LKRSEAFPAERGDVRWLRLTEEGKRRPVLILGHDEILPSLSQIPVIPLSTQIRGLPWEVKLSSEEGMPVVSVLKPEWIRSVERSTLGSWITTFPLHRWPEVRNAVLHILGLEL